MPNQISLKNFLLLIGAFLIYSLTGVCSKMASSYALFSREFISIFAVELITVGIYAILWQIVLGRIELSKAFLFKSSTVVFSLCWAYWIFGEAITIKNIIGASLIIVGIVINSTSKKA